MQGSLVHGHLAYFHQCKTKIINVVKKKAKIKFHGLYSSIGQEGQPWLWPASLALGWVRRLLEKATGVRTREQIIIVWGWIILLVTLLFELLHTSFWFYLNTREPHVTRKTCIHRTTSWKG